MNNLFDINLFDIDIGIFGTSNVGKSLFTNALIGKYCSEVSTNKKSKIPQIYQESEILISKINTVKIKDDNTRTNLLFNPRQIDKISPIVHDVAHLDHLHNNYARIRIHDLPRLDDENSDSICYWIEQQSYDIIIFIIDINSGLGPEQISVLKFLINLSKIKNCKIVCLMNKCESICYDSGVDDLIFTNDLHEEMFVECNNKLAVIANQYLLDYNNKSYSAFFPISSKNYFVHRMLGSDNSKNNQIKHSGFYNVFSLVSEFVQEKINEKFILRTKSQDEFISNSIKQLAVEITDIEKYAQLLLETSNAINNSNLDADTAFDRGNEMLSSVKNSTNKYFDKILKINTNIIINDDYIDFEDFDSMHATLQQYCRDLKYLVGLIDSIKPSTYFPLIFKQVLNKLFKVYDQLCTIDISRTHVCPSNMIRYLTIIKNLCPDKFDHYACKFLYFSMMCQNHYIDNFDDLLCLLHFVKSNTSNFDTYNKFLTGILSGRQSYYQKKNPNNYLFYLFKIQDIMENHNYNNSSSSTSIYLSNNSSASIYISQLENSINIAVNSPYNAHGIDDIDTRKEEEIIKLLFI